MHAIGPRSLDMLVVFCGFATWMLLTNLALWLAGKIVAMKRDKMVLYRHSSICSDESSESTGLEYENLSFQTRMNKRINDPTL